MSTRKGEVMQVFGLWMLNALTYVGSAMVDNEVAQWIGYALSIAVTILNAVLTIIKTYPYLIKFINWIKKSFRDGKITDEEIKEGEEIVDEIKDTLKGDNK